MHSAKQRWQQALQDYSQALSIQPDYIAGKRGCCSTSSTVLLILSWESSMLMKPARCVEAVLGPTARLAAFSDATHNCWLVNLLPAALCARARAHVQLKQYDEAVKDSKAATQLDPGGARARDELKAQKAVPKAVQMAVLAGTVLCPHANGGPCLGRSPKPAF